MDSLIVKGVAFLFSGAASPVDGEPTPDVLLDSTSSEGSSRFI
jgi:hypothetical protein